MKQVPMLLKYFLFLLALAFTLTSYGQIKIGDNPQNIDGASVLELESESRVLVITRITTDQMNAITPREGAIIYNTDTQCLHYFDGTAWINVCDAFGSDFTFTTDPIVNTNETIAITRTGDVYNFEVTNIRSQNIVDFSINGVDLQENSITDDKLAPDSVGSEELQDNTVTDLEIDYAEVTLSDFTNDANYLTAANIISGDPGNDIIFGSDTAAFYDDEPLQQLITNNNILISQISNDILANTNAIAAGVLSDNTTLQGAGITGNELRIRDNGVATVQIANEAVTPEKIAPGLADQILRTDPSGTFVSWVDPETGGGTSLSADNVTLETTGEANNILQIRDAGVSTTKIAPGGNNEFLSTDATGTVAWAPKTSTDADNDISIGTDGGVFFENPVKAIGKVTGAGNLLKATPGVSVVRTATGTYDVSFATPMPDANYIIQVSILNAAVNANTIKVNAQTANGFSVYIFNHNNNLVNRLWYFTILDL